MKIKYLALIVILLMVLVSCKKEVVKGVESSVNEIGDVQNIKITTPSANIRSGCSNTANVVQAAEQNDKYEVVNPVGDWYAVKLPDNSIGFVPQSDSQPIVDKTKPPTSTGTTPDNGGTGTPNTGTPVPNTTPSPAPTDKDKNDDAGETTNKSTLSEDEQTMVALVNAARAENNLPALTVDTAVANVARTKAKDMIDKNYFSHNSPTYGSPFDMMKAFSIQYVKAGENIAGNQSVQAAHDALMKSPGHRANILSADYTHIGIGIVDGGDYGKMFTQMFISQPQ